MPAQRSCHAVAAGAAGFSDLATDWVARHTVEAGSEGRDVDNDIVVYFSPGCPHCRTMLEDMRRRGPPPCADRVQFVNTAGAGERTTYRVEAVPTVIVRGEPVGSYAVLYDP